MDSSLERQGLRDEEVELAMGRLLEYDASRDCLVCRICGVGVAWDDESERRCHHSRCAVLDHFVEMSNQRADEVRHGPFKRDEGFRRLIVKLKRHVPADSSVAEVLRPEITDLIHEALPSSRRAPGRTSVREAVRQSAVLFRERLVEWVGESPFAIVHDGGKIYGSSKGVIVVLVTMRGDAIIGLRRFPRTGRLSSEVRAEAVEACTGECGLTLSNMVGVVADGAADAQKTADLLAQRGAKLALVGRCLSHWYDLVVQALYANVATVNNLLENVRTFFSSSRCKSGLYEELERRCDERGFPSPAVLRFNETRWSLRTRALRFVVLVFDTIVDIARRGGPAAKPVVESMEAPDIKRLVVQFMQMVVPFDAAIKALQGHFTASAAVLAAVDRAVGVLKLMTKANTRSVGEG